MKYTLTLSDCSKSEIENVLNNLEGGNKVEVAAEATTSKVEEAVVKDPNDLDGLTKADLQELCDSRALQYAKRATKKDLIDLLEGRTQPVVEEAVAVPPVIEAPLVEVPAATTTAINETPAVVQHEEVIDVNALIAQFTDTWNQMLAAGFAEAQLQTNVNAHLGRLNHSGTRLSLLPPHILQQFLGLFRAECGQLIQPTAPVATNAFI